MASNELYDMSVVVFTRQLENLRAVLKKGQEWASANGKSESDMVNLKLTSDMQPLPFQVQTSCNSAVKVLIRVAGMEVESIADDEKTFAEFDARIVKTIEILKRAKPADFQGKESKNITFQAGPAELTYDGLGYLQEFALPNFMFHYTMAYALLRQAGVDVGKFDFLGKPSKGMQMLKK